LGDGFKGSANGQEGGPENIHLVDFPSGGLTDSVGKLSGLGQLKNFVVGPFPLGLVEGLAIADFCDLWEVVKVANDDGSDNRTEEGASSGFIDSADPAPSGGVQWIFGPSRRPASPERATGLGSW
jgi:hypothetical protein